MIKISEELFAKIKENVIKGRRNEKDEDLEGGSVGEPGVKELIEEALEGEIEPKKLIECINDAMLTVGKKFDTGEYFVPDMLASAEAVSEGMEVLEPQLSKGGIKKEKFVVATVEGDIHDIGKNIFAMMLKGAGFDVIDLGTDVSADEIVKTVKNEDAEIIGIGLSALLTTTMGNMGVVTERLRAEKLEKNVLVGGVAVSKEYADEIGAIYCDDAFEGVDKAKELIKKG